MATKEPTRRIRAELRQRLAAEDPLAKVRASRGIREAAEELETDAIAEAREAGITWSEIGACYGLTKQGAQQRFKPALSHSPPHKMSRRPKAEAGRYD